MSLWLSAQMCIRDSNKVLSATINTTLKYDNDVKTFDDNGVKKGAKVQFKEVLEMCIRDS